MADYASALLFLSDMRDLGLTEEHREVLCGAANEITRLRAALRAVMADPDIGDCIAEDALKGDVGAGKEPMVGEYRADYSPLTPEEIAKEDPELTELYERSQPVGDARGCDK